jgi:hypothetical protein
VPYKHRRGSAFDVFVNDISSSYNTTVGANSSASRRSNSSSSSSSSTYNNISNSSSNSSGNNHTMSSYYMANRSGSFGGNIISNSSSFDNTSSSSFNSSSSSFNTSSRARLPAAAPARCDACGSISTLLHTEAAQQHSSSRSSAMLHAQGHANEVTHDCSEAAAIAHSAQLMCSMRRRSSAGSSEGFSSRDGRNSSEGNSPQYNSFNMLPGFELSSLGR